MSTSEQEKFNQWWDLKGTNSVILRAQAWSAWLARAEVAHLQPAEDPDEWVVQDRVPVRIGDRGWWENARFPLPFSPEQMVPVDIECDEFKQGLRHGYVEKHLRNATFHVMCRRRDLPKVEQAEQWPKYYVPVNAAFSLIEQKPVAYFRRDDEESGETFHTDGTSYRFDEWTDNLVEVKQLTEAEAMALLKTPEPQPQKTRVRLWMRNEPKGRPSVFACDERPYPDSHKYVEIHHDSEGFYYTEG